MVIGSLGVMIVAWVNSSLTLIPPLKLEFVSVISLVVGLMAVPLVKSGSSVMTTSVVVSSVSTGFSGLGVSVSALIIGGFYLDYHNHAKLN